MRISKGYPMKVHISQWLLTLLVPCDLSRGAMSRGQTMLSEVQRPSMGLCMMQLSRAVGLQPIEKKELSWDIARKSSSILAESKYRKSQPLTIEGDWAQRNQHVTQDQDDI